MDHLKKTVKDLSNIIWIFCFLIGGCTSLPQEPSLPPMIQEVSDFLAMSMMPDVVSEVEPEHMELSFTITKDGVTRRIQWISEEIQEGMSQRIQPVSRNITPIQKSGCQTDGVLSRFTEWLQKRGYQVIPCQRIYGVSSQEYADIASDQELIVLLLERGNTVNKFGKRQEFFRRQGYQVYVVTTDMLPWQIGEEAFLLWIEDILKEK